MEKITPPIEPAPKRWPRWLRLGSIAAALALACISAVIVLEQLVTNPFVPAGHVGYIYEEPRFFGSGGFRDTVEGPTSYGASAFRLSTTNVDVRPRAKSETITIANRSGDVTLTCDVITHVDSEKIKMFVENFGGADDWYEAQIRPHLLSSARKTISKKLRPTALTTSLGRLGSDVTEAARRALEDVGLPFVIDSVHVSKIDAPSGFRIAVSDDEIATPREVVATSAATTPRHPVRQENLIEMSHRREFRGAWLSTASNVDWPSSNELSSEEQQQELVEFLDKMVAMNMNALFLQVRGGGDTIYPSPFEPFSPSFTGEQGKAPEPAYDPLAFAIAECKKRCIEFHAWVNPYRAKPEDNRYELASNHVAHVLSDYAYDYGKVLWMDPGAKPVQDWILKVVLDLVRRYDIDGLHFDDYFYPYPKDGIAFPDERSYEEYITCCGAIERDDWRRLNVDTLVRRVAKEVRATKPWVKFGVSPFGIYKNGEPDGIQGLDQYGKLYADPKKWLEKGWVDYIAPQLYWKTSSKRPYDTLLQWWGEQNALRRHVYAGIALSNMESRRGNWSDAEFEKQFSHSRDAVDRQSFGNIVFGMRVLQGKMGERAQKLFTEKIYPDKALPPAMPWISADQPSAPTNLRSIDGDIRWDPAVSPWIRHWAIYRRGDDNLWTLDELLPASTTRLATESGTYAATAVDRAGQESTGGLVDVAVSEKAEADSEAGDDAKETDES